MGVVLKKTNSNIIRLWFGADTPIRQHKIKTNPNLWLACKQVGQVFRPPSGVLLKENYLKSDKIAFASAVQEQLQAGKFLVEIEYERG